MNSPLFAPNGTRLIEDLPELPWVSSGHPLRFRRGVFASWTSEGKWTATLKDGRTIMGEVTDLVMIDSYHLCQPYRQRPLRGGLRHGTPLSISFSDDRMIGATVALGESFLFWRMLRQMAWHLGWRPH